jgi:hypothetical protein
MNFERTASISLHIFFSREGREINIPETSKRAFIIVGDKSILAALGLQCSCKVQCSDCWNKQALHQACQNYALLTKLEQLQKVYDILLGARNIITLEITLTIAGNIF